jgi:Flp pilus assembly protein TadB
MGIQLREMHERAEENFGELIRTQSRHLHCNQRGRSDQGQWFGAVFVCNGAAIALGILVVWLILEN